MFFSRKYEGRTDLFEGLSIFGHDSDKEKYRNLQGKFLVIFLAFANIKAGKYLEMENKITEVIVSLYNANDYLLDDGCLNANEKEYYKSISMSRIASHQKSISTGMKKLTLPRLTAVSVQYGVFCWRLDT